MSELTWIRHPVTGALVEAYTAALPMYRQSGWEPLTEDEVTELHQARADEVSAAESDMRERAAVALGGVGAAPPVAAESAAERAMSEQAQTALVDSDLPTAVEVDAAPGPTPEVDTANIDATGRQSKKGNA